MPIVAEKLSSRQGSRSAIASQFWECAEHSTRYIDGQVWELPCEPPALNLTGSSGLSRSQQLIAAQSLGLPAMPSYDDSSGGLVLDRVITKLGGKRWWTAISGRIKAQRMYAAATGGNAKRVDALKDLGSYALCARTRAQLGNKITLNATIEAPDTLLLRDSVYEAPFNVANAVAAHAALRTTLPGHDLTATMGHNMDYVESSGDYARVPLAVSLDLSSHDRSDGLQYRVGLHQVTAPRTEASLRSPRSPPGLRTVLHAQGAVAVEGEAFVWRPVVSNAAPSSQPAPTPAASSSIAAASTPDAKEAQSQTFSTHSPLSSSAEATVGADRTRHQPRHRMSDALASAVAADSGEPASAGQSSNGNVRDAAAKGETIPEVGAAPPSLLSQPRVDGIAKVSNPESSLETSKEGPASSLSGFIRPLERLGDALHSATHPRQGNDGPAVVLTTGTLPITADSLSNAIAGSLAALRQLRETVNRVTSEVQDGSLQRLSEQLSRKQGPRKLPYSMLLSQPYLKLHAAMGCLARMPLPPWHALASLTQGNLDHGEASGNPPLNSSHHRNASASSLASRASISSQLAEAWEPYLKGTALRVFASAGISGQVGRFTRPLLDYTSASLRVDVGLTSPHVVGAVPTGASIISPLDESARPDKHRGFALEGRGAWHGLSVSLAQQVVGPLRARADFRFALDPSNVPQDAGERSTLKGLAQTALSVRPSLLEAVYGADVVLPGTGGVARAAVWWSPKRKEAMAELRLF